MLILSIYFLRKQCQTILALPRGFYLANVDDIKIKRNVSRFFPPLVFLVYLPFIALHSLVFVFFEPLGGCL